MKYTDSPVYYIGIGHDTGTIDLKSRETISTMPAVKKASAKAFAMCGLTPPDIDVAEVHDCFTISELLQIEDIGFCDKGMGKQMKHAEPI